MVTNVVRKAVIPVAGLGTRFLPITKAIPKEMLPVIDKPVIHYIVEEAFTSGIEQIVLVNGHHKYSIENYFDTNYELNDILQKKKKIEDIKLLANIEHMGTLFSVRQKFPAGLGHAVLCARPFIGEEPFAVLLGDDVICSSLSQKPGLKQLMEAFRQTGISQVALLAVPRKEVHKYGAAEGKTDTKNKRIFHIQRLVEKPPQGKEKTDKVVVGRYVLTPTVWNCLLKVSPDKTGEIQLTEALSLLLKKEGLLGYCFEGERIDTGDRAGFLRLILKEALSRKELKKEVLTFVRNNVSST